MKRSDDAEKLDLVVKGEVVWTGTGTEPLRRTALGIRDGVIVRFGSFDEFDNPRVLVVGGRDRLVMPGLVNGHVHLPMVLFRGMADDLPLMSWLEDHIWPAEADFIDEESVYQASLLALAEMIGSGTTCLAEAYFCASGVLKAVAESGIRAVVAQGNIDFPAPGVADPARGLEVSREFLDMGRDAGEMVKAALFCHAPYTCSPERLIAVKELCREYQTLCFIHLAETQAENSIVTERYGLRPTAFLGGLGFLDQSTVAVHAVHLDESEIGILAERATALVTCPESNMKLASGLAGVPAWLKAGLKVGLGTDGAASNNDLNMFGEMGSLARVQKAAHSDPTALPAEAVLNLATKGGAEALGFTGLGELALGAKADMITLDLDQPHLMPLHNLPAQLVYATHGGEVRDVIAGGRILMINGQLTTIDLKRVRARVREMLKSRFGALM